MTDKQYRSDVIKRRRKAVKEIISSIRQFNEAMHNLAKMASKLSKNMENNFDISIKRKAGE